MLSLIQWNTNTPSDVVVIPSCLIEVNYKGVIFSSCKFSWPFRCLKWSRPARDLPIDLLLSCIRKSWSFFPRWTDVKTRRLGRRICTSLILWHQTRHSLVNEATLQNRRSWKYTYKLAEISRTRVPAFPRNYRRRKYRLAHNACHISASLRGS